MLSVITSLFLPPSVIAGIFGMNLAGLPFTESPSGFVLAMLPIAASPALVSPFGSAARSAASRRAEPRGPG